MPNWVFNTLNNYPKEVYEKYKSEDRDIDFNKIIPEPEEITNTISGSINETAKQVYHFNEFAKDLTEENELDKLRSNENPLYYPIREFSECTVNQAGHLAIANPDESLNQILSQSHNYQKNLYDDYVKVFGNVEREKYDKNEYDKFIEVKEEFFNKTKNSDFNKDVLANYKSLADYGKHLTKVKEKYGFDNWYDWRNAHWGTKWNACESNYDEECESVHFDTAWSIPYPVIAKIADENPDVKLDGYSEEETGWFEEYETANGKLTITGKGELQWDEETDETTEVRDAFTPVTYTYAQIAKESIDDWKKFTDIKINF